MAPLPELPGEVTQIKKVPGLEKLRKPVEDVMELGEEDLEEIPEVDIELSEEDLEEMPKGYREAELRMVESKEKETDLKYGLASEASIEHPDRNEDAYLYSAKRGLQFVADGMGGVPAGDLASQEAQRQLTKSGMEGLAAGTRQVMEADRETVQKASDVEAAFTDIINHMNNRVIEMQKSPAVMDRAKEFFKEKRGQAFDPDNAEDVETLESYVSQIGATVSMSKFWKAENGKDMITVGNVGDSRTYRLRNGALESLSVDDSPVRILLEEGLIKDDQDVTQLINKRDVISLVDKHPELKGVAAKILRGPDQVTLDSIRNNISQAVGVSKMMEKLFGTKFKPFVKSYEVEDGDVYLTMSDGVIDNLTDDEIQAIAILHSENPLEVARQLQQAATERSIKGKQMNARAKPDDVTALVTSFKKNGK